ncbi:MAG: hypothetical protein JWM34_4217 [Ilumatobacteraceae bacterium]|nr:hypothetical protein [Ilumatobacteraceae bacterium]
MTTADAVWQAVAVGFSLVIAYLAMITGLTCFCMLAAERRPLSRAARPLSWELVPARYLPLMVAGLAAAVMSIR